MILTQKWGVAPGGYGARVWTTCCLCESPGARLCANCSRTLEPPARPPVVAGLSRPVLAPFAYCGAARDLILGLKLRARRDCSVPLVDGMVACVLRNGLLADAVAWVPGRRRDTIARGFDHAEVLARGIGARLGLPVLALVGRARSSEDQSGLSRIARMANVAGAFVARPCALSVVLVDDLVTTGATAVACVRALSAGGAAGVEVLVAAAA